MAVFRDDPADLARLDFHLLQNSAVHLYHRPAVCAEDLAWLRAHGYVAYSFDCSRWRSEDDLHDDFARALAFPDWYGRNLDGLSDLLGELAVPDEGGVALHLARFDAFAARHPRVGWDLLDILAVQSRRLLLLGHRLVALVQSDDPRIELAPVGATPVMWNPRERFEAARGL